MIDEKRAMVLQGIDGDKGVGGQHAGAAKGCGLIGVGLGADEGAVGGKIPEISAAGMKVRTGEGAKEAKELGGIVDLERGVGKFQEKVLERLVRLRRVAGRRNSRGRCQWVTNVFAKQLKTIGLHIKPTLDSQIESREYEGVVPTCETAPR